MCCNQHLEKDSSNELVVGIHNGYRKKEDYV